MAWCWQGLLRGVGDPSQKMESVSALTSSQDFIGGVQAVTYSPSCFYLKGLTSLGFLNFFWQDVISPEMIFKIYISFGIRYLWTSSMQVWAQIHKIWLQTHFAESEIQEIWPLKTYPNICLCNGDGEGGMPVKCNLWGILETVQDGFQDRWWPAKRKTSWPHLEISIPGLFDVFPHYCQEL